MQEEREDSGVKNLIVLEDDAERIAWFVRTYGNSSNLTICTTVEAFKSSYSATYADAVFLDHDLGGRAYVPSDNPNTGYQAAKFIAESMAGPQGRRPDLVLIHSYNADGAKRMMHALQPVSDAGSRVVAAPFGTFNKGGGWGDEPDDGPTSYPTGSMSSSSASSQGETVYGATSRSSSSSSSAGGSR
jgi:hypothetical protein